MFWLAFKDFKLGPFRTEAAADHERRLGPGWFLQPSVEPVLRSPYADPNPIPPQYRAAAPFPPEEPPHGPGPDCQPED